MQKLEMLIKTVDAHYDSKHQIKCIYLSCSLLNIARGTCNIMIFDEKSNFQNKITIKYERAVMSGSISVNNDFFNKLQNQLKLKNFCNIHFVNEEGSTLRARFRYWEIWPPNYLIRWVPKEILFPPNNLDAIVALILLEDFLKYSFIWPDKLDIKIWP